MNNKKIDLSNFDFNEFKADALTQLKSGQSLTGKDGILTPLIKELLEAALEGEMEAHIAESHELGLSPRRNGKTSKLMKSTSGVFDLETPRDRDGSFEPEIVKKRQTVLNESLDNKVLALYALGMSYEAISGHLAEMYFKVRTEGKVTSKAFYTVLAVTPEGRKDIPGLYLSEGYVRKLL